MNWTLRMVGGPYDGFEAKAECGDAKTPPPFYRWAGLPNGFDHHEPVAASTEKRSWCGLTDLSAPRTQFFDYRIELIVRNDGKPIAIYSYFYPTVEVTSLDRSSGMRP